MQFAAAPPGLATIVRMETPSEVDLLLSHVNSTARPAGALAFRRRSAGGRSAGPKTKPVGGARRADAPRSGRQARAAPAAATGARARLLARACTPPRA